MGSEEPSLGVELAEAGPVDLGPDADLIAFAKAALAGRAVDSDLAALMSDSLTDDGGSPDDHRLEFRSARRMLSVRVGGQAGRRSLSVECRPPVDEACLERAPGPDAAPGAVLAFGGGPKLSLTGLSPGTVRIRVRRSGENRSTHTDWFRI
ncbi:MAG TPA: hypothetical protein VE990_11425 [Acidimicrobiales bacterium]|nr:hypothetical protein [Acidimicrobiales bacterium]